MAARKKHSPEAIVELLRDKGIYLQAKSKRVIAEEAPDAYKDIDRVVEVSHRSGIARKVARFKPLGVAKG
jgi:tRNA-splicing ligase RtcB